MLDSLSNAERAEVITQALPYIKKYVGKVVVVKYGRNGLGRLNRPQDERSVRSAFITTVGSPGRGIVEFIFHRGGGRTFNVESAGVGPITVPIR